MRRHRAALTHRGSDPVGVIAMVQQRPQRCPVIPTLRPNRTWPRHGKIDANDPRRTSANISYFGRETCFSPTKALIRADTMTHPSGAGMRERQFLCVLG